MTDLPGPLSLYLGIFGFAMFGPELIGVLVTWCRRRVRLLPGATSDVSAESMQRGGAPPELDRIVGTCAECGGGVTIREHPDPDAWRCPCGAVSIPITFVDTALWPS